jgi:hypothetical protein
MTWLKISPEFIEMLAKSALPHMSIAERIAYCDYMAARIKEAAKHEDRAKPYRKGARK